MSNESLAILVRSAITERVQADGMPKAERDLEMSKHTLARIIAGLPVRAGTLLAAARALGLLSLPAAA